MDLGNVLLCASVLVVALAILVLSLSKALSSTLDGVAKVTANLWNLEVLGKQPKLLGAGMNRLMLGGSTLYLVLVLTPTIANQLGLIRTSPPAWLTLSGPVLFLLVALVSGWFVTSLLKESNAYKPRVKKDDP